MVEPYGLGTDTAASPYSGPGRRCWWIETVSPGVGFGDISAVSQGARTLVSVQIVINLVFVGLGLRIIVGAAQRQRDGP